MRTSELTGKALDWAVAKCEGVNEEAFRLFYEPTEPTDYDGHGFPEFHYSSVWHQGGRIMEREIIGVQFDGAENFKWWGYDHKADNYVHGETPLIAAMRCYVTSKLGEFVDIPEELT